MKRWYHKYFKEEDLRNITASIAEAESRTSGQIRVHLRRSSSFKERRLSMHEIAVRDFHRLGMHKTKHQTGVLIFILFRQKYFDIVADTGIHKKIPSSDWHEIEAKMKYEFRKGRFGSAVLEVIKRIGDVLASEFPKEADGTNELSDEVSIS